jgi:hypothetical protein
MSDTEWAIYLGFVRRDGSADVEWFKRAIDRE